MNNLFWAISAILADAALFTSEMQLTTSLHELVRVSLLHAGLSAVLATCAFVMLPAKYRRSKFWAWGLMFNFAFIAPVLGPIGILLIIHFTLVRKTNSIGLAVPRTVELPIYDVQIHETPRAGQGAIRSRLTQNAPDKVRMQSLLTLQVVPSGVANPILENLLGDDTDDVRLVAFGMLDAAEKRLSVQIHAEQKNLAKSLSTQARYDCYRHLAELHLEMVQSGLVQGEMRKHVLSEALQALVQAMSLHPDPEAGLLFLEGRVFFETHVIASAESAFKASMSYGQSEDSVLPYLAELAFIQRDFEQVRGYMSRLITMRMAPRTNTLIDFWTGRDSFQQFRDVRILQHI